MGLFDKVKGVAKDKIKDIDAQKEAMSIGKIVSYLRLEKSLPILKELSLLICFDCI